MAKNKKPKKPIIVPELEPVIKIETTPTVEPIPIQVKTPSGIE